MSRPIEIEDYDPRWPKAFADLRYQISSTLGGLEQRIEHVGSTSVPGLAAKPIIDLIVVINTRDDLDAVIRNLETLGYHHEGDLGLSGREAFTTDARHSPLRRTPRTITSMSARKATSNSHGSSSSATSCAPTRPPPLRTRNSSDPSHRTTAPTDPATPTPSPPSSSRHSPPRPHPSRRATQGPRAGAHSTEVDRAHYERNRWLYGLRARRQPRVVPPTTRQSRSCHVHTQTSLPSESAKTQNARAWSSLTSRPPAARAASTRATASSCGTVRSR